MTSAQGGNIVEPEEYLPLGESGLSTLPLGVGTWQWGDKMMWSYSKSHTAEDVKEAFQTSWEAGIRFFDTAEIYGSGLSERLLGSFLAETHDHDALVATKVLPLPWRSSRKGVKGALLNSLKRLNMKSVDLYQVHWPTPLVSIDALMDKMAELYDAGLIKAIGVSNFNAAQTKRAHLALRKRNISLASNQVEYSLLNRKIEHGGLRQMCKDLGVSLIAYSPLAKGALTGKYNPEHLPVGMRSRIYNRALFTKIQPLMKMIAEIGAAHGGKTPAQVSLNWAICKGTIVIPGAKNAVQALHNIGALGWRLSSSEVEALDQLSQRVMA